MRALLILSLVFSAVSLTWAGEVVHPGSLYVYNLNTIKKFDSEKISFKGFDVGPKIDSYQIEYLVKDNKNNVSIELPSHYYQNEFFSGTIGLSQLNDEFKGEIQRVLGEVRDEIETAQGLNRLVSIEFNKLKSPPKVNLNLDQAKNEFYSSRAKMISEDISRVSKPGLFPSFMNGTLKCNGNEGDLLKNKIKSFNQKGFLIFSEEFHNLTLLSVERLNKMNWEAYSKSVLSKAEINEKGRLESINGYSHELIQSFSQFHKCAIEPIKNEEILLRKAAFLERLFKMKYGLEFLQRVGWEKIKEDLSSNFGKISISSLPANLRVNYQNSLRKDASLKYYKELKGKDIIKILSEKQMYSFLENAQRENKPIAEFSEESLNSSEVLIQ